MDSWDAPGNSSSKIRVVGYALSVVQRNLPPEELKSPEDGLCVGPQLGALPGGPGRRLVLPPASAHRWGIFCFARRLLCNIVLPGLIEEVQWKIYSANESAQQLTFGEGLLKLSNNFPQLLFKKTNRCAIHVIVTEKMGVNQLSSVLKTGSFQFALL